jgi:hypothetical protein
MSKPQVMVLGRLSYRPLEFGEDCLWAVVLDWSAASTEGTWPSCSYSDVLMAFALGHEPDQLTVHTLMESLLPRYV